jgi:hypothetical protein
MRVCAVVLRMHAAAVRLIDFLIPCPALPRCCLSVRLIVCLTVGWRGEMNMNAFVAGPFIVSVQAPCARSDVDVPPDRREVGAHGISALL